VRWNGDAQPGQVKHRCFVAGPIRDFRDLVCWQQAIELALVCEDVADALPRKAWKAAQQLRDAADSVHLNIAEGNGRPTLPDYLKSLGIADSSLNEVQSNLYKISRRYPAIARTATALKIADRVAKPLYGLIKALKKKRRDSK
jgi:four helix bundle protein